MNIGLLDKLLSAFSNSTKSSSAANGKNLSLNGDETFIKEFKEFLAEKGYTGLSDNDIKQKLKHHFGLKEATIEKHGLNVSIEYPKKLLNKSDKTHGNAAAPATTHPNNDIKTGNAANSAIEVNSKSLFPNIGNKGQAGTQNGQISEVYKTPGAAKPNENSSKPVPESAPNIPDFTIEKISPQSIQSENLKRSTKTVPIKAKASDSAVSHKVQNQASSPAVSNASSSNSGIRQSIYLGTEIIDKAMASNGSDMAKFSEKGVTLNFEAQSTAIKNGVNPAASEAAANLSSEKQVKTQHVKQQHIQAQQQSSQIITTARNKAEASLEFGGQDSAKDNDGNAAKANKALNSISGGQTQTDQPLQIIARRDLPVKLVQMVQNQNFTQRSDGKQVWHKHRILLDEGKSLNVAVRKGEGILQLQLSTGNIELNKIIQQHLNEIRQHLQQQLGLDVELHLQQNGTGGREGNFEEHLKQEDSSSVMGTDEVSDTILDSKESTERQSRTRYYGFNKNEWTA